MKLYVRHDNEICEMVQYQNTKGMVQLQSPTEGRLFVPKKDIEVVGFRNGKGATGEIQSPNIKHKEEIEHCVKNKWIE